MEKGKFKKEEKYISVILVPHFSAKVKALKFSALYSKLIVLIAAIVLMLACLIIALLYTLSQNNKLSENIDTLNDLNAQQHKMLSDQSSQIDELLTREKESQANVKKFMDKYREMTDNYIDSKTGGQVSDRSGDLDQREFSEDMKELKVLLDKIKKDSASATESSNELSETEVKLQKYMDTIPTLWPIHGEITSEFGVRRDPFNRKKIFHDGLDLAGYIGEDIVAAADGKVILSAREPGFGRTVMIDHGHGLITLYGHASKLIAEKGQMVKKGELIAKVGSSGRSTGAHLHFTILLNNNPVDPLKYLQSN